MLIRRLGTPTGIVLALIVAVSSAVAQNGSSSGLSLKDFRGNPVTLDAYRGKIVVLNFWATWCGPCTHEMPMLADVGRHYADKNVVVIGVSIDDPQTLPKVEPFIAKRKIDFPILVGGAPETLKQFDLGIAVPATAFIAADGSIPFRVLGEIKKKELLERLEWMAGNHSGTEPKPMVNNLK
jgi:thiol-disulfide isomerase/thioredoxin